MTIDLCANDLHSKCGSNTGNQAKSHENEVNLTSKIKIKQTSIILNYSFCLDKRTFNKIPKTSYTIENLIISHSLVTSPFSFDL